MLLLFSVWPLAAQWRRTSRSTDPQSHRMRIVRGIIFDEKRTPIAGAVIIIENAQLGFRRETLSDERGLWRMSQVLAMNNEEFRMTIKATRYLTRKGPIYFVSNEMQFSTEMHSDPRLEEANLFSQAEQACRDSHYDEALPLYTKILIIDMNNYSAILGMGICRLRLGQLVPAEEQLLRALAMAKAAADVRSTAMALEYLGNLAIKRSDFPQAKDYFTQALESEAGQPELWEKLGDTCALLQQPREASAHYQKALALQADIPGVAAKLARQKDNLTSSSETAEPVAEKVEAAVTPPRQDQSTPAAADEKLATILKLAAGYCRHLETAGFRYFCTETVEEETWPGRTCTGKNQYRYDFQIIGRKRTLYERRTLLEENGRQVKVKNVKQKTIFQTSMMFFSPIDLLSDGNQPLFTYGLLGSERIGNQDCLLLDIRAKAQNADKPLLEGRVLLSRKDGSVLRIDVAQNAIIGLGERRILAQEEGYPEIEISNIHWYEVEKNGLHFPSRAEMRELYLVNDLKTLHYVVNYAYSGYNFFQVDVGAVNFKPGEEEK